MRARGLLSEHMPLAVVLGIATLVRGAVAVAYAPALFYNDSFSYINVALSRPILGMTADRPSGYPGVLRVLSLNGTTLTPVAIAQHVAGLVTGVLVYALLYRVGARRWISTAVAAVVVFEGYAIALEQHIMAEAFATLALVASVYFLVHAASRSRLLVLSGLLLALAVGMRTATAFAVLPWFIYLVWTNQRRGLQGGVDSRGDQVAVPGEAPVRRRLVPVGPGLTGGTVVRRGGRGGRPRGRPHESPVAGVRR
jgi:hypothetical protein